jgi:hypothetical protein
MLAPGAAQPASTGVEIKQIRLEFEWLLDLGRRADELTCSARALPISWAVPAAVRAPRAEAADRVSAAGFP